MRRRKNDSYLSRWSNMIAVIEAKARADEREKIALAIEAEGRRVAEGGFPVAAFDYGIAAHIARNGGNDEGSQAVPS